MKKVLLTTDMAGLELAKAVLHTYLSDTTKFIGKLLILQPNREVAEFSLNMQPSGYEEVGTGMKAQWHAILATYRDGYEPFILSHAFPDERFDMILAIDSLAAETCLAGREPGTKVKSIIIRSGPRSISPANVRAGRDSKSVTTRFLRESVYSDKADRVDMVYVASVGDRATITNNLEFINSTAPIEAVEFPVFSAAPQDKAAVRSTMSLPGGGTLKPEDKVICVKLPTSHEVALRQPDMAGLLELIYELSLASGKTTQPKWLVLCGTPGFRQAIKNDSMPPEVTHNVLFMGRADQETFFDTEALVTALSASDIVVDVDRDHGYDIFLETALTWGMPVVSVSQGNITVKAHGTNLLGSTLDKESAVKAIKAVITGDHPAPKLFKRQPNHSLIRMLEND